MLGPSLGEQIAERGRLLLADGAVEARHDARRVAQREHLLELQARCLGDLVVGRRAPELGCELALRGGHLALALGDVRRQADRAPAVVQRALDRLPDPQRRVGREAEALAPVELLHGADQSEDALLDQVEQRQIADALVLAGDRDDEPQVRVDHALLGGEIATLDRLG